jgi:hypothetical protein
MKREQTKVKWILFLFTMILTFSQHAQADWVWAEGSYAFPETVAEADACAKAEERARIEAIRKTEGEVISAEEVQFCADQTLHDTVQCSHNSAIWTSLGGRIVGIKSRTQKTVPELNSYRRCIVGFDADVRTQLGSSDPAFTLGVSLNAPVYRDGEQMVIQVQPSQPMYIQVFQWQPTGKTNAPIIKLFPNEFDTQSRWENHGSIPSEAGRKLYDLKVFFPDHFPATQSMADEYVMVIATRTDIAFRDTYTLDDFEKQLAEIPRNDSRIVRRSYAIVRGAQ